MPFVLTVDQRRSRRSTDLVDVTIDEATALTEALVLPFERTAGDEFQGVVAHASDALVVTLHLTRSGQWSTGVGVGAIEPGASTRSSRGPAFLHARNAVELAKRRPHHVAIRGPGTDDGSDAATTATTETLDSRAGQADALATMLAAVVARRTDPGWEAVDLIASGSTIADAATTLNVSRQAIGQRLAVALWREELDVRQVAERLLTEAESQGANR